MKKITLLATLLTILSVSARSQAAKSIYAELGGPGVVSFNFDTRFSNKEDGLGGRIGFGGFTLRDWFDDSRTTVIFIPIALNYLLGKDGKNYFEVGGGVTPVIASTKNGGNNDETFSTTFGHLLFGYRLQPRNGGFTFRGFISPIFNKEGFIPYYGGISLGYKF